jgi:putative SOS response-associated peptidase YedK
MCYINGVRVSLKEFIEYKQRQKELKQLNIALLDRPAHKGFDYGDWPVIKPEMDGMDWNVVSMEWGFLPGYLKNQEAVIKFRHGYKDNKGFHPPLTTLNAIGEEMLKPGKMFREAALKRRCLVLSSGFFEHRHIFGTNKRNGQPLKTATKYPYHITLKDKEVFMMAGIYNSWIDQGSGEIKDTFAILTTAANTLMKQVHNSKERMPVILPDDLADEWTNPDLSEERITAIGTYQYPAHLMSAYPVAKDFLANVDPTEEFIYPELPPLVAN